MNELCWTISTKKLPRGFLDIEAFS